MAIKGLTTPVIGDYENTGGTVTYSNPLVASQAVEYSATVETGDDNPFYADDGIKENDKGTFVSGELSLSTADLPQDLSKRLLGTTTRTDSVPATVAGGDEAVSVTVQVFDDAAKAPYLGVGVVETHQIDDADVFRAVFFNKVYFNIPENAATTKGETIEWQNPTITGVIQRSDEVGEDGTHPWMEDAWLQSKAEAIAWLKWRCGDTGQQSVALQNAPSALDNEEEA